MEQQNKFFCPHCRALLNVKGDVIFSAESSSGTKGLLYLSHELGNYTMEKDGDFKLHKGETLKLFCPVCRTSMSKKTPHANLARITMQDTVGKVYDIYISAIVGEQCTYKISGTHKNRFGKDSANYDFFYSNLIDFI